jgi:hypothetical protein
VDLLVSSLCFRKWGHNVRGAYVEGANDAARALIAERRLLETQQVLVQERLAREVTEAILGETAKALSAVRRAAAEGGGATSTGVPLKGGGEEAAMFLTVGAVQVENADYLESDTRE